jgi:hypothetical protein
MTGEEEKLAHAEFEERNNRAVRKLLHCLNALKMRAWVRYEWFYAGIDREYFNQNEFSSLLRERELDHIKKATRVEWGEVRRALGKPRRLSPAFLRREREKLAKYRGLVRAVQARPEAAPSLLPKNWKFAVHERIQVGQCVTAYCRRAQLLQRGHVLTADYERSRFRVQFERGELQSEICCDTDIAVHGVPLVVYARHGAVSSSGKSSTSSFRKDASSGSNHRHCLFPTPKTITLETGTPSDPLQQRSLGAVDMPALGSAEADASSSTLLLDSCDSPSGIFSGGPIDGSMDSAALASALQTQLPSIANNPEHSLAARTGTQLQRTKQVHLMVQLVKLLDRKEELLKALRLQNDRAEQMQRDAEARQKDLQLEKPAKLDELDVEASASSSSTPSSPSSASISSSMPMSPRRGSSSKHAVYSREFQKECSWIVNNIQWNNENLSRVLLGLRRLTDAPPASEPVDLRGLGGLVTGKDGGLELDSAGLVPMAERGGALSSGEGANGKRLGTALLGVPIRGIEAPVMDEIEAALARDAQRDEEVATWISNHLDDFGRSARLLVQHTRSVMREEHGSSDVCGSHDAKLARLLPSAAPSTVHDMDAVMIQADSSTSADVPVKMEEDVDSTSSSSSSMSSSSPSLLLPLPNQEQQQQQQQPPSPPPHRLKLPQKERKHGAAVGGSKEVNTSAARSTAPPPGRDGHGGNIHELVASCVSLLLMMRYCVENRDLRTGEIERAAAAALERLEPLWHRHEEKLRHRHRHDESTGHGDMSVSLMRSAVPSTVPSTLPISMSPGRGSSAGKDTDLDTSLQSWHPDSRPPISSRESQESIELVQQQLERTSSCTARILSEIHASIALLENEIKGNAR